MKDNIWVMTITTYKNQSMESVLFSELLAFGSWAAADDYIVAFTKLTDDVEELDFDLRDNADGTSATIWRSGKPCFVLDVVPLRVAYGVKDEQSPFLTQVGANPCFFEYVFT